MNLHDHDLIYKAKNDGRAEGKQETKIANAKNALDENIPIETVAKICDLPLETVQKMAEEIKSEK